ncbi:hypothetical protein HPG69_010407 [Diceros bicornis minor]|uniref:Ig-like domain-containing protein n=1 Tax=Diceros bicornis minor TaxID=77932 RepID=A0A7J7F8G5_DICBM|nr:hypothetical protein HPG69_010407 [Diceros bicornis minor]
MCGLHLETPPSDETAVYIVCWSEAAIRVEESYHGKSKIFLPMGERGGALNRKLLLHPQVPSSQTGREFEGEEEYLEILGITREQSGKYECKAANEVSSADVKQVKVTVNYPPTITESKSNEATTGRQASLKCEASAVPAPDFEWYRDDTRITSANGLEIKSTEGQSSLTVTNVTEEHYGNYTCVAANNLGVTNASLVLFSKYAKMGQLGRTSGLNSPMENLQIIPHLLKVNLYKSQNVVTETKTQVLNPYA